MIQGNNDYCEIIHVYERGKKGNHGKEKKERGKKTLMITFT